MTLRFEFKEFLDEIAAFSVLASSLLDESARQVLAAYAKDLQRIRDEKDFTSQRWEIRTKAPLKTAISEGCYEPHPKRGSHHIQAHLSSTWSVTPIKPKGAKSVPVREFELSGIASTRVEFHDVKTGSLIGLWKMEIGNPGAPGCHFHIGIGGDEGWTVFPSTLSVPRLPGFLFSAMAVAEFVLNELFQDQWPKIAARPHSKGAEQWNPIQRRRLLAVLRWQHRTVLKASKSSPWCDFKSQKPAPDIFDEDPTKLATA